MARAQNDDVITRYVYDKKFFNQSGLKENAFIDPRNLSELSVVVITEIEDDEIWEIAKILRPDARKAKARGDLVVKDVRYQSGEDIGEIDVIIDGNPHPLHANIQFPPLEISRRRAIAAQLAEMASLQKP